MSGKTILEKRTQSIGVIESQLTNTTTGPLISPVSSEKKGFNTSNKAKDRRFTAIGTVDFLQDVNADIDENSPFGAALVAQSKLKVAGEKVGGARQLEKHLVEVTFIEQNREKLRGSTSNIALRMQ